MSTQRTPTDGARARAEVLGRYRLVAELGSGGMASVHLASAVGPGGFQRWFAVKRIHPHLAKDRHFVDMFLDEARISAAVQHPNVAQVIDLGQQGGEFFIAMEYLHGDHLGRLATRCIRAGGHVPYALAARIIGATAEGLHHAHEAKGPRNEPLNLVHRDVSPHNIFLTYDGQVKITDFGIAKAAGRITHTQTGSLKGKVAYMSPEQALGGTVDRRTDIFALGVTLWEITTGQRLFRATTDAQTLMRITSGKVKRPSQVLEDYPKALEKIVLKALASAPEGRYATAADMARDLDEYIRSTGEATGTLELQRLMETHFAQEREARDQVLALDASAIVGMDLADRSDTEIPLTRADSASEVTGPLVSPRASRAPRFLAFVAAAGLLGGLGVTLALRRDPEVRPAPTASPPVSVAHVSVSVEPRDATVRLGDQEARSPARFEIAPGTYPLRVTRDGFVPSDAELSVVAGEEKLVSVQLSRLPTPPAPVEPPPANMERAEERSAPVRSAEVFVTAVPWASVRISGQRPRTTPTDPPFDVAPGRVTLHYKLRDEGDEQRYTFPVREGQRAHVTITPTGVTVR